MRGKNLMCVLAVTVSQFSCATISQINLLSTKDEIEIGRQAATDIESQLRMLQDDEVVNYVRELGKTLAAVAKRQDVQYVFNVVDTEDVNAFALPGGWLYVNAGLIATAETESELAGVMAHEIGHVVGHHGARQITAQFGLTVLLEVVGGGPNGESVVRQIAGQFAGIGAGLTMLKYSRDMEREADALAVEETYAAGIDPVGVADFFRKLMSLHQLEASGLETLFATHPPSKERVDNVSGAALRLPKKTLSKDSTRFQTIRAKVAAHLKSKPKVENR